jgi:hypothetical protein
VGAVPLVSEPLGFLGVLIVMIIALLFLGLFIAATFGPVALVIAAIVKSFRNSAPASAGVSNLGMSFTMSSETKVVALDPASPFAQAFGASLQRGLGGQLGQTLAQMMTMAAAQQPIEIQLAPMVMAIEAARRQGDVAAVQPFLTDRFAARFPPPIGGGQGAALTPISHMTMPHNDRPGHGDQVVIQVYRGMAVPKPSEYWIFQQDTSAVPDGTPAACPKCGAPTAGDRDGTCRFCGATFSSTPPALPSPTRWLLADITATPPALAA